MSDALIPPPPMKAEPLVKRDIKNYPPLFTWIEKVSDSSQYLIQLAHVTHFYQVSYHDNWYYQQYKYYKYNNYNNNNNNNNHNINNVCVQQHVCLLRYA